MIKFSTFIVYIFFILFCKNTIASDQEAEIILNSVDDLYRSKASYGKITLTVTTINWKRTLTLEQWSKGQKKSLIKVS